MFLGAHLGDVWLPLGIQWETLLGPKLDFVGVIFEVILGTDSAAILGGAGGRGGAFVSLQGLQEHSRKFSTPAGPGGS